MATTTAVSVRNEQVALLGSKCDGGYLRIYGGAQPSTTETKAKGSLLAELRFGSPAFGKPTQGKITATSIADDTNAKGAGTATWYRCLGPDEDVVWDGDVSKKGGGGSLALDSLTIQAGAEVSVASLTYTQP